MTAQPVDVVDRAHVAKVARSLGPIRTGHVQTPGAAPCVENEVGIFDGVAVGQYDPLVFSIDLLHTRAQEELDLRFFVQAARPQIERIQGSLTGEIRLR